MFLIKFVKYCGIYVSNVLGNIKVYNYVMIKIIRESYGKIEK